MLHRSRVSSLLAALVFTLPTVALGGTLEQIRKSGEIRIGYPPNAAPLSFNDASGQASGYSVELCRRVATAVKESLKLTDLKVTFVPLGPADRIEAVEKNKVDIECGATTMTLSREEKVDFTLMTFVTGGSLLSIGTSNLNVLADAGGKSIAVVSGTTTEAALKAALAKNLVDARVVAVPNREEGMKQLDAGQVDAFASDQVVLIGQVLQSADPRKYNLGRELFSYEPYGFVVRRDDSAFRVVVDRALAQVYRTGQIEQIYNRWFGQVGIKPSNVLTAMYLLQALPE